MEFRSVCSCKVLGNFALESAELVRKLELTGRTDLNFGSEEDFGSELLAGGFAVLAQQRGLSFEGKDCCLS